MDLSDRDMAMLSPDEIADLRANEATMDDHIGPDAGAPLGTTPAASNVDRAEAEAAAAADAEGSEAAAAADPAAGADTVAGGAADDAAAAAAAEPAASAAAAAEPAAAAGAAPAAAAAAAAEPATPEDDEFAAIRELEASRIIEGVNPKEIETRSTRLDAIPAEILSIRRKFDDGEIDAAERDKQETSLLTEQSKLSREIGRLEARQDSAQEATQNTAIATAQAFIRHVKAAGGPDYNKPLASRVMQDAIGVVNREAVAKGERLTFTDLYARADRIARAQLADEFGLTFGKAKPAAPAAASAAPAAGKPAAKPAAQAPQRARSDAPMGKRPADIGAIPSAEPQHVEARSIEAAFAGLDGEDAEIAFLRMSPADQDRLLNGWRQ